MRSTCRCRGTRSLHLTQQTAGNGVVTHQVFAPNTGQLTSTTVAGAVQSQSYTYDLLSKLLTRADRQHLAGRELRVRHPEPAHQVDGALTPTPLVNIYTYSAIGNLTFKSDVGAYNYPAPGQPRPHGVTSISGGTINTTFTVACPRVGGSRARGTPRAT